MNRRTLVVALTGLVAATTGCRSAPAPEPTPATETAAAPRRIELTKGATLSISVDTEGRSEVEAILPPGHPDAGTYVSRDGSLLDVAREAKNSLNERGVKIAVFVDASGAIVGFSHEVTR